MITYPAPDSSDKVIFWEIFLQELTKCSQAQTLTSFEEDGGRGRCHRVGARGGSVCLLYTSPSPRDSGISRMPSSA